MAALRVVAGLLAATVLASAAPPRLADTLRAFDLRDAAERPASVQPAPGQALVVSLFATWCTPCIEEMPDLSALHRAGQQAGTHAVVGLNVDLDNGAELADFARRYDLDFPVYYAPATDPSVALGAVALPTAFILAPDGSLARTVTGPEPWGDAVWLDFVGKLAATD